MKRGLRVRSDPQVFFPSLSLLPLLLASCHRLALFLINVAILQPFACLFVSQSFLTILSLSLSVCTPPPLPNLPQHPSLLLALTLPLFPSLTEADVGQCVWSLSGAAGEPQSSTLGPRRPSQRRAASVPELRMDAVPWAVLGQDQLA